MLNDSIIKLRPKEKPKTPSIVGSKGELSALGSFLYETLASDEPGLDPIIMQVAVKRVLQDVTPEVLQQMEQEYANAVACILKTRFTCRCSEVTV